MMIPVVVLVVLALLFVLLSLYRIEYKNHLRNLKSIPVRILVNGSRGKSSVVRLIAAGLRAGGKKVIAKTTGTSTRLIFTNAEEVPVIRLGMPTIREQIKVMREAARRNPDVVVLECMTLRPDLQLLESRRIVKPTIVVITNVRADHLDVMGPTIRDVAETFISVVPKNCVLFTAESRTLGVFTNNADKRNIRIFTSNAQTISDATITRFPYIEHKENISLARDVCKYFGVDEKTAFHAMYTTNPDPGVSMVYTINFNGKKTTLINALAANDPESTYSIWQSFDKNFPEINLLINSRKDRIFRSLQFAQFIKNFNADHYILTGSGAHVLARNLHIITRKNRILNLGEKKPEQVFDEISKCVANRSLIFSMGNAVGYGEKLLECFLEKGQCDVD